MTMMSKTKLDQTGELLKSLLQTSKVIFHFLFFEPNQCLALTALCFSEDAYKTQVRIDDEPAYLDILDTAGQAEFTAMRDQYMRGGEDFIISSEFKELIYRVRHTYDIPLVLVGNKIDLEEFRQVSTEEGMSLAREYSCSFFETSAALRFYIDDVFHGLVREIRRKESSLPMVEKKMKRKDSLWRKLKGSLKKKKESTT
uniref:Ras like without CAAX 2 n=1 Tax=Falco tinnunculus TaxID=100819 RepID=A0A8C4TXS4_FALTI